MTTPAIQLDLTAWLRQQLDTDTAEIAKHPDGEDDWLPGSLYATREQNYPCDPYLGISKRRALAEVDAKRRILDEHQNVNDGDCGTCVNGHWGYPTHGGSSPAPWPCPTLRLLALPYADRPGYREEWRP